MRIEKRTATEVHSGQTTDGPLPAIPARFGIRIKAVGGAATVNGYPLDEDESVFIPVDRGDKINVQGTASWIIT